MISRNIALFFLDKAVSAGVAVVAYFATVWAYPIYQSSFPYDYAHFVSNGGLKIWIALLLSFSPWVSWFWKQVRMRWKIFAVAYFIAGCACFVIEFVMRSEIIFKDDISWNFYAHWWGILLLANFVLVVFAAGVLRAKAYLDTLRSPAQKRASA